MKTNETLTQTSDQIAASRVLTRCAPCLLIAKKSTRSATNTNATNKDHMSGEPMDCMTAFEVNGSASPRRSLMRERRDDVKDPRRVSLCRRCRGR